MIIYFDKFAYRSNAASALLLKRRVELEKDIHKGDFLIFSTTKNYKNTVQEEDDIPESKFVKKYIFKFTSLFFLYLGFYLFYFNNRKKIDKIVSHSAPGSNLFFFAFSPFSKITHYVIQDVYPDAFVHTLGLIRIMPLFRFFLRTSYNRIGSLETISKDMCDYLYNNYRIKPLINYNPNIYSDKLDKKILNNSRIVVGYSGNFSNSHGYKFPAKLIEVLNNMPNIETHIRGFGKYYDTCKENFSNSTILFGSGMNKKDYLKYLESLDVILLFQEWDYEKYCLSCKFNSTIEFNKPIIYVGPKSDISRYIDNNDIGLCITSPEDFDNIIPKIDNFFKEINFYIDKAQNNKQFDLNQFFNEYYLSNK